MKRKHNLNTLLLLAALPLSALAAGPTATDSSAPAAPPPPAAAPAPRADPAPMFSELDVNHDKFVTRDEAKRSADLTARFDGLDTNHDGKVSAAEYAKGTQGH